MSSALRFAIVSLFLFGAAPGIWFPRAARMPAVRREWRRPLARRLPRQPTPHAPASTSASAMPRPESSFRWPPPCAPRGPACPAPWCARGSAAVTDGLVYVLTVLARDGKVARLTVDAVKGTLVGGLKHDPEKGVPVFR